MGVWIPILALAVPVLAVLFNGLQKVYKLRIEETRLRSTSQSSGADGAIEELRTEVDQLRRELGEVQERLDFPERLLAKVPDPSAPRPT